MRRSPNPEQRRRTLCDAAIALLAAEGIKGVTHLKVDAKAAVPKGSTSFYFRTNSALFLGAANRVAELDLKDLATATREQGDPTSPSGLAKLVMSTTKGARLQRAKARNELALQASRNPELADVLRRYTDEFSDLIRDAVTRFRPEGLDVDPAVVNEQVYAVRMFIGGVMLAIASGDRYVHTSAEMDRIIAGIVKGVAATPPPAAAAPSGVGDNNGASRRGKR
jgi:DNA-binding transcriptional regulator YbjK